MAKNMYSLMLLDEVVCAIDELAAQNNTNRSNMINQILAEYVSYTTPEMRIKNIFENISAIMHDISAFDVSTAVNSAICIKSALCYKYRPTIRYLIDIYTDNNSLGELKVTFRTQSSELLMEITHFLKLWIQLEEHYISKFDKHDVISYTLQKGKFTRKLMFPQGSAQNIDDISGAIADYIQMFDEILKGYLNAQYNTERDIERRYLQYLENGLTII